MPAPRMAQPVNDPSQGSDVTSAPSRTRTTLLVVCFASFMLTLDVTIVSVALSRIQSDLDASLPALEWVVNAYTLTLAGGLLSAAVLGDRVGRLRVFVAGLWVFTAASLACALAGRAIELDVFRAVQGLGAALLFGTALPLLGAAFPDPGRRAKAVGAFGASYAAGVALGPLIGGALVEGPGWRFIFLINVPFGLLALLACRWLGESRPATARGNDWAGAALLTTSLLLLLVALIRGNQDGWSSAPILAELAAAAVLLVLFVAWERRTTDPMCAPHLFRRPAFVGVALQSFATAATLVAATYYLALHMQNVAGFSPFESGLRFLPLTLTAFVAAPLTAALLGGGGGGDGDGGRRTVPILVLGLVLAGGGLLLLARLDPAGSFAVLLPGMVLAGAGLGAGAAAVASAALATVDEADAGMATGTVNMMRQIGTCAGVAVLGALLQHEAGRHAGTLTADLASGLTADGAQPDGLGPAARDQVVAGIEAGLGRQVADGMPEPLREQVATLAASATTDALTTTLAAAGAGALLAALAVGWLLTRGARD